ncbi:ABC transporter ATP-binding protein [Agrococcus sediminis]|uniref:ABC transporter ATP-binding protein n=1 Tax=Agrococcus sediminis TaxID=2599924 RepID=A0A5M8QAS6_9MICO|nr:MULTISPECIES: ABC transporter ATP-binding protein [Agrococcus]KAA6432054.1 ABC transporter ATP-binding protein [Agrococcus sediminis]MDR7233063.1 branched-chain amino acid transport system ATP-binding protein [Agrococcus sp. BE272]RWR17112.1 ABC transporter ATP-binding protein [Agrococcus lahaulensis]UOV99959.1 ABC transporter ATP-binding protein [Agrococcus sp. SCSIO52902]
MEDRSALVLDAVGLQIGGARILHDVSFEVATGEMVGVIGPNGAGKTTLFNVISGVLIPTSGRVLLAGKDVTSRKVHQRARVGLGRTFQTSSVFPGLSARENVRLAAQSKLGGATSPWRMPRAGDEATAVAMRCLDEVELAHHAGTDAGVLSHGDKRKLEIAMLLATEPEVVLLDEPMAGVGSGDVAGLVEVIRRLHRSGRTVLMVEHHMEVLLGLVDRVAVMHHGELLAIDTPKAVMADTAVQQAYLGETV